MVMTDLLVICPMGSYLARVGRERYPDASKARVCPAGLLDLHSALLNRVSASFL